MMEGILGLPTTEGNSMRGASSPERPALQLPEPLSMTTGTLSAIKVTNSKLLSSKYIRALYLPNKQTFITEKQLGRNIINLSGLKWISSAPNKTQDNNFLQVMYSKGVINTSSEALFKARNQSMVVPADVEQVEIYKKEKRRAKYQGLSHLYQNDYKPAVYKKAVKYRDSMSYKKKLADGSYKQLETFEDTNELKAFGLGPYFFVEFQRRITWLFFICAILEGFRIFLNYKSSGLTEYTESFSTYLIKSTIGNYDGPYTKTFKTPIDIYIMTIIPCFIYLVVFLFYLCWKKHYSSCIQDEENDLEFIKPEKFCIEVEGFEEISRVKEEELEEFFSSFGPVYEVSLARQYDGKLKYFEELDELEEQIKEEELQIILGSGDQQNLAALRREKDELNKYINTLRIRPSVKSAFVHFQFEKSKVEMEDYYNNHYLVSHRKSHSLMRSLCCCCVDDPEPKHLFKGHKLFIRSEKVPEPEDLNWDYYEVGGCGKVCRMLLAIFIIVFFLAISCALIGLCSIYISSHAGDCEGVVYPSTVTEAEEANLENQQKKCFCSANFVASLNNDAIVNYCGKLMNSVRAEQAIQYGITATSAIVNFAFGFIVDKIVNLTQPLSFSRGYLWKTSIYTIFIIINTVLLPLLIYADIFGVKPSLYVSFVTLISKDIASLLNVQSIVFNVDFTTNWYSKVSPVYTNYIIIDGILTWVFFFIAKCTSNRDSLENDEGTILQKSMNQKITSWQLKVFVESAYFYLIIFMGFFFSSGIPVLVPLAFLNLFSKYITNRSLLQSNSSRVEGLSEDFNSFTFILLPLTVLCASLVGDWMLTANDTLTSRTPMQLNWNTGFGIFDRLLILPFFVGLAILVVFQFALYNLVIRFFGWIAGSCYDKKEVVHPYYTKEYSHYAKSMSMLHSYNPRNNRKYKNAIINMEKYLTLHDDKL